jgi:putative ABC transport system permease protein
MFRVSRATLAERWTLFIGAALSVALGVALVQSSLLLLLSAATSQPPVGASPIEVTAHAASTTVAVTVLAVTLAFAAFLAFFIIGTTFAFTVDQRARELALLRLVGADRRQVRRLLVGEAVLLGGVGTATGVPLGIGVMAVQADLLMRLGFVPAGFAGEWQWWILGASVLVGLGLSVSGVLLAARRAASIAPLAALRDGEVATAVMTRGRWITAGIFGAAAAALLVLSPTGGASGGQAMAMNVSIAAAIALTAATPLLVPLVARMLPVGRGAVLTLLAQANLRDNIRRSASTAAPLVILVGILVGQSTALLSFSAAGAAESRALTVADVVVESTIPSSSIGDGLGQIAKTPGVASASTEVSLSAAVTTGKGEMAFTEISSIVLIDPAAFTGAHPHVGSLSELRGATAVAGPSALGISIGDTVRVEVGAVDLGELRIVAATPETMAVGPALLLPINAVPQELLAGGSAISYVTLDTDANPDEVSQALTAFGTVDPIDEWQDRNAASGSTTATSILIVVLGLGALYALIGVVNSVVIASATRRHEFAVARASGLTRAQVVRVALLESALVTTIGVSLGLLAAVGTLAAVGVVGAAVVGAVTIVIPWPLVAATVVGAFVVTSVTSVLTSRAATADPPVELLRSRE